MGTGPPPPTGVAPALPPDRKAAITMKITAKAEYACLAVIESEWRRNDD